MIETLGPIGKFIQNHYRHFNAAALKDAAVDYCKHIDDGGKMMVTLAGAMSTAELGKSLAEMIRQNKVHAITCTGANLEEDVFNLVAHEHYKRVPNYRDLTPAGELELLSNKFNRVTDTCIPEEEAMRRVEKPFINILKRISQDYPNRKVSKFPHEILYHLLEGGALGDYQADPRDSWLVAAAARNLPLFVPGWEDSTLGNMFAAQVLKKELPVSIIKGGIEYMTSLAEWYQSQTMCMGQAGVGFFQIGGGIAGDFPICVVPMLQQDMKQTTRLWDYFCQISDSVTSYGGYSGATPNEKITWGKLGIHTPKHIVESDATIVAPLMFAWILGW